MKYNFHKESLNLELFMMRAYPNSFEKQKHKGQLSVLLIAEHMGNIKLAEQQLSKNKKDVLKAIKKLSGTRKCQLLYKYNDKIISIIKNIKSGKNLYLMIIMLLEITDKKK